MRSFRSGNAGFDIAEVQLENIGKQRVGLTVLPPHTLLSGVCLDQGDLRGVAARQLEVVNCLTVDREGCRRAPEFGGHVAQRRPVRQWQPGQTLTEEFDKFSDDGPCRATSR